MKDGFSIDCNVESIATLNPRTFDDENLLPISKKVKKCICKKYKNF
jgi:hypothetical protein